MSTCDFGFPFERVAAVGEKESGEEKRKETGANGRSGRKEGGKGMGREEKRGQERRGE